MNKQFMIVNGKVIVSTEEGMKSPVEYVENIDDILLYENEIEFLKSKLAEDEKYLEDKVSERENRKKAAKKVILTATGVSLVAGGTYYLGANVVDSTFIQQLSVAVGGCAASFGILLGWMEIKYGPSKNIVPCYEERISYEKGMIEILSMELDELRKKSITKNNERFDEMVSYPVNDVEAIRYLKESLRLRDIFGYHKKAITKMYKEGKLFDILKNEGFSEDAIMDFSIYLESKSREETEEISIMKK